MRYVIHIDLDFFYGQVEQALNPSLKTLPFAIQQKHIVVTCNYLARNRGIRKLQLLADARRICPHLVIVNGEDITRYRQSSRNVFKFVRELVNAGTVTNLAVPGARGMVQRLGMDELWIDATDIISENLCNMSKDYIQTFFIGGKRIFEYDYRNVFGHLLCSKLPQGETNTVDLGLVATSHLAYYLRCQIFDRFTFTSSAGISSSKVFSKLVGGIHKPEDQTTITPEHHQFYIREVEVKKIMGVGFRILRVLWDNIAGEKSSQSCRLPATFNREYYPTSKKVTDEDEHKLDQDNESPQESSVDDSEEDSKVMAKEKQNLISAATKAQQRLTCSRLLAVLKSVSPENPYEVLLSWLSAVFTEKEAKERAAWLFNLLRGNDDSEIVESQLYPKSIGVEDSFLHCSSLSTETVSSISGNNRDFRANWGVRERLIELMSDLVLRMESDLMEDGRWVKFPSILRLTPRFRDLIMSTAVSENESQEKDKIMYRHQRISKSCALSNEVFECQIAVKERVMQIVDQDLIPLFKKILAEKGFGDLKSDKTGIHWDLSLLNVTVCDMSDKRRGCSIQKYFSLETAEPAKSRRKSGTSFIELDCPEGLDFEVWNALENPIKQEVLRDLKRHLVTYPSDHGIDNHDNVKRLRYTEEVQIPTTEPLETGTWIEEDDFENYGVGRVIDGELVFQK